VRSATLRGSSGANGSVPNEDALIDGGGKKSMMEMSSFNLLEEDLKNGTPPHILFPLNTRALS